MRVLGLQVDHRVRVLFRTGLEGVQRTRHDVLDAWLQGCHALGAERARDEAALPGMRLPVRGRHVVHPGPRAAAGSPR
jgi:hypothetical protein